MWFLILLFNAAALFVFYRIFSDRIAKNSGLTEVADKFKKEINTVAVNFNRISSDNITLLEEKSLEVRELLKLINMKIEEYKKLEAKYGEIEKQMSAQMPVSPVHSTKLYVPDPQRHGKPKKPEEEVGSEKALRVLKFFDDGKPVDRIARELDISEHEVRYYLKRTSGL
jgi:hypothetical protein